MKQSFVVGAASVLALAFLLASPAEAKQKKKAKGPVGVYWVEFFWEADLDPFPDGDGDPERYFVPGFFTFHADGTLTDSNQDPNQQFHAYWKKVGKRKVKIRTIAVGKDFRVPPDEAHFTSELFESEVTFSKGYETFTGVQWGKTWLCPPFPWGAPGNWQCPNPITTEEPPDYETGPDEPTNFEGWRLPEP